MDPWMLLGLLTPPIVGILAFLYWRYDHKQTRRNALREYRSDLKQVLNEYYRFSRDHETDRKEHDRIISKAQVIIGRAADMFDKNCPQDCINVHTEADADRDEFMRIDAKCRQRLRYIARKRLTQNQVTRIVNQLECDVWGEYLERNEQALDDALKILDGMKS